MLKTETYDINISTACGTKEVKYIFPNVENLLSKTKNREEDSYVDDNFTVEI